MRPTIWRLALLATAVCALLRTGDGVGNSHARNKSRPP